MSLTQAGGSAVTSYHLQYDNATKARDWLDVVGLAPLSMDTRAVESTHVQSGAEYLFRVQARNIFGWGPYSEVTPIQAAREPDQPVPP